MKEQWKIGRKSMIIIMVNHWFFYVNTFFKIKSLPTEPISVVNYAPSANNYFVKDMFLCRTFHLKGKCWKKIAFNTFSMLAFNILTYLTSSKIKSKSGQAFVLHCFRFGILDFK